MLAIEVAQRKPALVVVTTISAALAAQRTSATIPIVMTGLIDPAGKDLSRALHDRAAACLSVRADRLNLHLIGFLFAESLGPSAGPTNGSWRSRALTASRLKIASKDEVLDHLTANGAL
jgi:hypothetical protein